MASWTRRWPESAPTYASAECEEFSSRSFISS